MTTGVVPEEPPVLGDGAWRTLLALLIESTEEQFGADWRAYLSRETDE
jgi:hypothetical protein